VRGQRYFLPAPVSAAMEQTWQRHDSFLNLQLKWPHMSHKKFLPLQPLHTQLIFCHFTLNHTQATALLFVLPGRHPGHLSLLIDIHPTLKWKSTENSITSAAVFSHSAFFIWDINSVLILLIRPYVYSSEEQCHHLKM